MKKIVLFIVIFIALVSIGIGTAICISNQSNNVKINGKTFTLKYSTCGLGAEVCMNEYYLENEYDTKWTELFTVVYSPTANNPKQIGATLVYKNQTSNLYYNDKDNTAIAEYGILFETEKGEPAIEQNMAKIMNYPYGDGVIIQQYARRYIFDSKNKTENEMKNDLKSFNDTYIKIINKLPVQKVYLKPLQKW